MAVAVAVADLSARAVAVDRGAAVAADLSARAVGHGAAAAVSREAVEGPGVEFPPQAFSATRGSLQQHGGSL